MWTHHHSIRSGWSCGRPRPMLNNNGQRVGGGQELHVHTLPLGPTACEETSFCHHFQKQYLRKNTKGRCTGCCWLTHWQSPPGVGESVLWRTSSHLASSRTCKLPQTHPRRWTPARGTRSRSVTAWTLEQLVSAKETDAGARGLTKWNI